MDVKVNDYDTPAVKEIRETFENRGVRVLDVFTGGPAILAMVEQSYEIEREIHKTDCGIKLHIGFTPEVKEMLPFLADLIRDGVVYGVKIFTDLDPKPKDRKTVTIYVPIENILLFSYFTGIGLRIDDPHTNESNAKKLDTTSIFEARISFSFSEKIFSYLEERLRMDFVNPKDFQPREIRETAILTRDLIPEKIEVRYNVEEPVNGRDKTDLDLSLKRRIYSENIYFGVVPFSADWLVTETRDKSIERNIRKTLETFGLKDVNLEEVLIYLPVVIVGRPAKDTFKVLTPWGKELLLSLENFSRDVTNIFAYRVVDKIFKCAEYTSKE
jgi:hypothetical protein